MAQHGAQVSAQWARYSCLLPAATIAQRSTCHSYLISCIIVTVNCVFITAIINKIIVLLCLALVLMFLVKITVIGMLMIMHKCESCTLR